MQRTNELFQFFVVLSSLSAENPHQTSIYVAYSIYSMGKQAKRAGW